MSDQPAGSDSPDAPGLRAIFAPGAGVGRELLGFLCVGGGGVVVFVLLSGALIRLETGVPDWIVSVLLWVALIGPVYLGHRLFSFRSGVSHRQALPRYVAVQTLGVGLVFLFSYLCYRVLGMSTEVAAFLVTALTSGVNFAILRAWAFAGGR